VSLRELRVPVITHNMASTHVVPSWATDSDRRQQMSPVLGKKSLSRALVVIGHGIVVGYLAKCCNSLNNQSLMYAGD
jgi:hypothetical protein